MQKEGTVSQRDVCSSYVATRDLIHVDLHVAMKEAKTVRIESS